MTRHSVILFDGMLGIQHNLAVGIAQESAEPATPFRSQLAR